MIKPDLQTRSRQAELMDAPDVDEMELDHAMAHLEFINRTLNGYGPTIAGIRRVRRPGHRSFSLLDIGCGSGDTLRVIAEWSRKRGLEVQLMGIELSERSAQRAAELCRDYPEITIAHADLFTLDPKTTWYDIVHCALVLHHFSDDADVVRVLNHMGQLSRQGIIVNDLHRHPLAYKSIHILTRTFSKSHILQNDAPLSVARSFTRGELENFAHQAGLVNISVKWHWAFRWLLTANQPLHDT